MCYSKESGGAEQLEEGVALQVAASCAHPVVITCKTGTWVIVAHTWDIKNQFMAVRYQY